MARKRAGFLILSILFACSVFGGEPINIPDPNLKSAIENWLEVSEPNISDMSNLIHFSAYHKGIKNLTGLEYATNLEKLWLGDNQVEDISIISGLTNLKILHLYGNQITDISALYGLVNLEDLYLYGNTISDISILSELTNLEDLRIQGNQISDLSALSGITSLKKLYLHLNQISDVSALSGLINLEDLQLYKNQISDISSLSGLLNLESLSLFENQISDISSLSSLVKLQTLILYNNKISDISPLSSLTNILIIGLGKNQIEDLSSLSNLKSLVNLQISENNISDLSHLSGLSNLETLWLTDNQINDISPLSGLINLKELYLYENMINDISALSELNNLQKLYINKNSIEDISILTDLPNLVELNLLLNPLNADAHCLYVPLLMQKDIKVIYRLNSPVGISATDGKYTDKVQIIWEHLETGLCKTSYLIYRSNTPSGRYSVLGDWQTSTIYEDTTALPGQIYYYWVKAKIEYEENKYNESNFSMYDSGYIFDANSGNYHIIYVDDDATGTNDGSSWENAYTYLQDALADANSAGKPINIRVAQGIYKPDMGQGITQGNREATFQLINDVNIVGGYAGFGADDPNVRDIDLYETILSGDLNDNDEKEITDLYYLQDEPSRGENSWHVVTCTGIDETAVLNGFTITAGNANGPYSTNLSGGGLDCRDYSNPVISRCIFRRNTANDGGGVNIYSNCSPTLDECKFIENVAGSNGGGIYIRWHDSLVLSNCIFSGNLAHSGGALYNQQSKAKVTSCTFSGNEAFAWGGAVCNYDNSESEFTGCTFRENSAEYHGGGMMNGHDCNSILDNCIFSGNFSGYNGGAISNSLDTNIELTNCTLSGNTAKYDGGGIYNNHSSNLTITNSIIWGNLDFQIFGNAIINFSNIQNGWEGEGEGNIDKEPLFVNHGYWADINDHDIVLEPNDPNAIWIDGDYHLKSEVGRWDPNSQSWVQDDMTSPCIDTGDPNSDWSEELWPHGGRINIGAYGGTSQASMSLSEIGDCRDLNNDGSITWDDVLLLAEKWNSSDVPLKQDLNLDGIVDVNDLAFYEVWSADSSNAAPVFDYIEDKYIAAGNELSFSLSAIDADSDELVYEALSLPEGAEFSGQAFTWIPEQVGTYSITFIASDYKSLDYITVQIVVE